MALSLRTWKKAARFEEGLARYATELLAIVEEIRAAPSLSEPTLGRILRRHAPPARSFSKSDVILAFRHLGKQRGWEAEEREFLRKMRLKPIRTQSGVAPVTVLTRPFPCPGTCIFCPSDTRMPKSYLSMEPGAQRAAHNSFDPYRQTWARLRAYHANGHTLDKIELIVLGGTWSSYPHEYQTWFLRRCFEAMNEFCPDAEIPDAPPEAQDFLDLDEQVDGRHPERSYNAVVSDHLRTRHAGQLTSPAETSSLEALEHAQERNADGPRRCVGLVLETRPDCITLEEVLRLRRLEIIEGNLANALSTWKIALVSTDAKARRNVSEVANLLRVRITSARPPGSQDFVVGHGVAVIAESGGREKVTAAVAKAAVADRCEALLALAKEWGAAVPDQKSEVIA